METKNSKNPRSKTGYKGIYLMKDGKYQARLRIRMPDGHEKPLVGMARNIGTFDTLEEAIEARVKFIELLF